MPVILPEVFMDLMTKVQKRRECQLIIAGHKLVLNRKLS